MPKKPKQQKRGSDGPTKVHGFFSQTYAKAHAENEQRSEKLTEMVAALKKATKPGERASILRKRITFAQQNLSSGRLLKNNATRLLKQYRSELSPGVAELLEQVEKHEADFVKILEEQITELKKSLQMEITRHQAEQN
ncbi:MAG: hypothetical protein CL944_02875 [Candidatus Diapherotrites archaeon]|uniref:Uncharacterized protein n=1 Tax=Candidatus Iainarchaeum sp. TaxID=3101447 RepID=A0A2D6LQE3_9ARCH|nr:hypothetical protein [Candidatus Diapherotrites archaeon]|tara:strand:+ start:9261 stop:9674 length:414 start_codon:yes stop_codon:yes gene_type:complete